MNKQRRKDITSVIDRLNELEQVIADIQNDLEGIRDEEQEYYDNMPENMQNGEKGELAQAAVDLLEQVLSVVEDFDPTELVSNLEEAMS